MAFEKTSWVINIEDKGEYIVATVLIEGEEEERKQTVRGEWVAVFKQANEEGRLCNWTLEKREGWKSWNVTKASLTELGEASPETQREAKEKGVDALSAMQDNPAPRTPAKKGTDTERNRSMALAYAKDLAVAGKIEVEKIMLTAETFVTYIEGE